MERDALLARIAELEREVESLRGRDAPEAVEAPRSHPFADNGRLRAMADAAPVMLWITNTEHHCTFLSRSWSEYTGQPARQGLRFGWLDMVHPEDRAEAERLFLDAANQREPFSLDHRLRRRNGDYRWVIDQGRPHFSESGEWMGYVGFVVDVHDRKVADEALRESERRYRILFDSIDEGFCLIDVLFDEDGEPYDYRFLETNPAFVKQTGLKDATGRTAREILPDLEPHWFRIYGQVARTGVPIRFEDHSPVMRRWFDVFAFQVENSQKVAILFTDISSQKTSQTELARLLGESQAARTQAELASQAKSQFLAVMSHELRTPLTGVIAYADLLTSEIYGSINAKQNEALSRIKANSWHLVSIIEEILTLSRAESGKEEVRYGPHDVAVILRDVVRIVEPEAQRRHLRLRLLDADAPCILDTDPGKLRQILINLLGNAVKYTAVGEVVVSLTPSEAEVAFHVTDTGPGVEARDMERIFEPFTQVDSSHTRTAEGTGLGLAISRKLARLMRGDILLDSTPGKGSRFTLRLPRGKSDSRPGTTPELY